MVSKAIALALPLALITATTHSTSAIADAATLNLQCLGASTTPQASQVAATSPAPAQKPIELKLSVNPAGGRIMVPFDMFGNGGETGEWFELNAIMITDQQISATIDSRLFGRPKLWVDRVSGHISISNRKRSFIGMCSQFDIRTQTRAF